MVNTKNSKGFTMVELSFVLSLSAMIGLSVTGFLLNLSSIQSARASVQSAKLSEVELKLLFSKQDFCTKNLEPYEYDIDDPTLVTEGIPVEIADVVSGVKSETAMLKDGGRFSGKEVSTVRLHHVRSLDLRRNLARLKVVYKEANGQESAPIGLPVVLINQGFYSNKIERCSINNLISVDAGALDDDICRVVSGGALGAKYDAKSDSCKFVTPKYQWYWGDKTEAKCPKKAIKYYAGCGYDVTTDSCPDGDTCGITVTTASGNTIVITAPQAKCGYKDFGKGQEGVSCSWADGADGLCRVYCKDVK